MNEQRFTIILKGQHVLTESVVEQIYGCCDDASAGSRDGIGHVHFDRPATSLNEAIQSALSDLRACGVVVDRIEIEPEDLSDATLATA